MIIDIIKMGEQTKEVLATWSHDSAKYLPNHQDLICIGISTYIVYSRKWITPVFIEIMVEELGED